MELKFKLCTLSNLHQLRLISEQTFVTAFEKDNDPIDFKKYIEQAFASLKIKNELLNPESEFYFAYKNDEVVGYFKLNVGEAQSELKYEYSIELERIYVLERYQGMGYGEQFLQHIKYIAKNSSKDILWLGVWQKNKRAIRFYERHGFYKFDTHPYFIGSDKQTDWLMRFNLSTL
ncbi:N-acetyltransferase [uncultured Maribacter sp.]|uniref:GNAT family N-acetyltransferase n=1 Tax=uncultured Maribacter sp. TaxID=431308 RepID=UPI00261E0C60|nr:GNAT family N-acetyltransferase [uncultured Maribacter sp.]